MIEVKNLVKQYGNLRAVDNLNFTLEKGEILGFLGPNGAGKSTTMNLITGYLSPTSGSILIDGYDIMKEPEKAKRSIGYLPEIPPLYPDMTTKEYLKFVAEVKGVKKSEREKMLLEIMELTKITHISDRLIKHLSKGYKQRVGLAGAIMGYPDLIILDEPTVGLDPMQIIEIRDLIKGLRKDHAIILSSHILSEISAICDEVMIINKGKLVASDTPDNLSNHMSVTNRIHLMVRGDRETIQSTLAKINENVHMEFGEEAEEGCVTIDVESEGSVDIREDIFYALASAKCPIYEMKVTRKSLEDIFLELTKEDAAQNESGDREHESQTNASKEANESQTNASKEENEPQTNAGKESNDLQTNDAENEAELNANTDIEEPDENAHKMNKEDY